MSKGSLTNPRVVDSPQEQFDLLISSDAVLRKMFEVLPVAPPSEPLLDFAHTYPTPSEYKRYEVLIDPCRRPLAYISGPMRGYVEFNHPAFFEAESALHAKGYDTLSPARMDVDHPLDWKTEEGFQAGVQRDIDAVKKADVIALLRGYKGSVGAAAEIAVAAWLKKLVMIQNEDLTWTEPKPLLLGVPEIL